MMLHTVSELYISDARKVNEVLHECADLVWATRKRISEKWATPGTKPAAMFALTEVGESALEVIGMSAAVTFETYASADTPTAMAQALALYAKSGQAIDAHLRQSANFSRNNDKDLELFDELADVAMMLITSLGSGYHELLGFFTYESPAPSGRAVRLGELLSQCSFAAILATGHGIEPMPSLHRRLSALGLGWQTETHEALAMMVRYFSWHDMNLEQVLGARLKRIERKNS